MVVKKTVLQQTYAVAYTKLDGSLCLEIVMASSRAEAAGRVILARGGCVTEVQALPAVSDPLTEAAMKQLLQGHKIGAIKEVRAVTGWGLKESKRFVDAVIAQHQEELYEDGRLRS